MVGVRRVILRGRRLCVFSFVGSLLKMSSNKGSWSVCWNESTMEGRIV